MTSCVSTTVVAIFLQVHAGADAVTVMMVLPAQLVGVGGVGGGVGVGHS